MAIYEPGEREILLRIANDQDYWDVYVTEGATGGAKILRNMKVEHSDENGTRGKLPRKAISIRSLKEGKTGRVFTDEQRAAVSERFRKYHADRKAADPLRDAYNILLPEEQEDDDD
jgi:hypothetical protein